MIRSECPVCSSFVVESKSGNEVFGRCFHCGYAWNHIIEDSGTDNGQDVYGTSCRRSGNTGTVPIEPGND